MAIRSLAGTREEVNQASELLTKSSTIDGTTEKAQPLGADFMVQTKEGGCKDDILCREPLRSLVQSMVCACEKYNPP